MEWYIPGALGDAAVAQSAIFVCMSRDYVVLPSEPPMHTPVAASGRVSPPRRESYTARCGFTLVELVIATVVLAVGLLALTSAGAATVKLASRGQRLSQIAAAGETRLEFLRTTGCASTVGQSQNGWLDERWSVTPALRRTAVIVDSVRQHTSAGAVPSRVYVFRSAVRC